MTISYDETLRNARLDLVNTRAGNGARLRIYSGVRPATAAAITTQTLLAELTCGTPFAPAAAAGVLTANAITQDASADATGTATWFRIVQADGVTFVMDGSVATSGSDLNLNNVSLVAGGPVSVADFASFTAGNT